MTVHILYLFWSHLSLTKIRKVVALLFPLSEESMNNYSKSLLSESHGERPFPQVICVSLLYLMTPEHPFHAMHCDRCQEHRQTRALALLLVGDLAKYDTCKSYTSLNTICPSQNTEAGAVSFIPLFFHENFYGDITLDSNIQSL